MTYRGDILGRFDPHYYLPFFRRIIDRLEKSKFQIVKLKEVCWKITDGTHYTPEYMDHGIPFLSVKDVRENVVNFNDTKFISEVEHSILSKRCKPEPNDVLLTKIGTFGLAAVVPENVPEFSLFVSVALLKIIKTMAHPYYVSYCLNTQYSRIQMNRFLKGIAQPDLHLEEIAKISILLPPLEIQSYIVEIMQSAYVQKRQKEQEANAVLDSIDDYVLASLGIEMPAVEEKKCFVVHANKTTGRRIDPFYYQNHYEVVQNLLSHSTNIKQLGELLEMIGSGIRPKGGVANIQSGVLSFGGEHVNNQCEIEINTPKYIPHEFHNSHKKTATQLNDLLLVKDGATTGKIGIVSSKAHIGQNINEHLFLLRTRDNVNPIYLLNYLNSCLGKLQIQREITGGTVTGITRGVVKRLRIIAPDLKKQSEIANHITGIRNHAKQLQREADAIVEAAKREAERILLEGASD